MVKFDQMWFIFLHSLPYGPHTSSIGVAALGFWWYRSSHPQLILEKVLNCRYDFIICLILLLSQVFFYVGEQKIVRWCQIRRIWQPLQPQTCVQDHCPGETGLALSVFQAIFEIFPITTFQSPELLIQCGFNWKETMQLVSGKVEFNACQVS